MKTIFLDHDGVICLNDNFGTRLKKQAKWGGRKLSMSLLEIPLEYRFDDFDKKAVQVLNEILKETDAEIVVSSDWKRWATVEEMGQYYEMQGIIKKPIDFTGSILFKEYDDFPWHRSVDLEQTRSLEIAEHLTSNKSILKWVSIDDLDMSVRRNNDGEYLWGLNNFVHTPRLLEGIKQSGVKEKVIKFLNQ